jgi:hypothetical protein
MDNHQPQSDTSIITTRNVLKPIAALDTQEYAISMTYRDRMQKILTALYLLTSLLDTQDSLGQIIRSKGTETLVLANSIITSGEKRTLLLQTLYHHLGELRSYITVAHKNGFFSEMNYSVIDTELVDFANDITVMIQTLSEQDHNHIASLEAFFRPQRKPSYNFQNTVPPYRGDTEPEKQPMVMPSETKTIVQKNTSEDIIKDSPIFVQKNTAIKKPLLHTLNKRTPEPLRKKAVRKPKSNEAKDVRKDNILKILKQKKDASINDICLLFKDCSSKTIQRDLIELIDERAVIKHGSRRWSTYNLG